MCLLAGIGWGAWALCRHNAAHAPSNCIAISGVLDFCVAPGALSIKHDVGNERYFHMTFPNGLHLDFALAR
jgi:hypothetical protein